MFLAFVVPASTPRFLQIRFQNPSNFDLKIRVIFPLSSSSLYQSSSDPVRSVIGEGSKSRNENSKTPNLDNNKSYSPKAVETGLLEITSVKCIF